MEKLQESSEVMPIEPTMEKQPVLQDMSKKPDGFADKKEKQTSVGYATSFGEKKKRRNKKGDNTFINNVDEQEKASTSGTNDTGKQDEKTGQDSEEEEVVPDYTYEELASRVFTLLRENNPELAGERRKIVLQAPDVLKDGTKRTVLANFTQICKSMCRSPDHVLSFLCAEAGTTGSLDSNGRLIIKSKFQSKNFEGLLRNYMNEYVICQGCKSKNTVLTKESRLLFLRCEQCGSSRSVTPVSTGYVARISKRKKAA